MTGWSVDSHVMGVTALSIGNAASLMTVFNPDMFTIRTSERTQGQSTRDTLHVGMWIGGSISVLVALGGSLVTGSWWPLLGTLATLAIMFYAYEWALKNPHTVTSQSEV